MNFPKRAAPDAHDAPAHEIREQCAAGEENVFRVSGKTSHRPVLARDVIDRRPRRRAPEA
jgi:hypothetical protein